MSTDPKNLCKSIGTYTENFINPYSVVGILRQSFEQLVSRYCHLHILLYIAKNKVYLARMRCRAIFVSATVKQCIGNFINYMSNGHSEGDKQYFSNILTQIEKKTRYAVFKYI
jgi:hypothetical protein